MIVSVRRTGGLVYRDETYELDTSTADPGTTAEVASLVATLGSSQKGPSGADEFQYDVAVNDADQRRSWRFYGESNPATPLIDLVQRLGKRH